VNLKQINRPTTLRLVTRQSDTPEMSANDSDNCVSDDSDDHNEHTSHFQILEEDTPHKPHSTPTSVHALLFLGR
jgi:hypothetical protein